MIKDYFTLAFKNFKHRGARSWLTLLGIFIGVTAVVALISLGTSLQVAVSSQFGISQTETITIQAGGISGSSPPGSSVVNPLTTDDLKIIKKINGVKNAVRRNMNYGKLEYNDIVVFGFVGSIPSGNDREFIYDELSAEPIAGRLLKDSDSKKVLLGYNFYADKVGIEKQILPGKKVLINDESFEVIGLLEKKGSFIMDNMVFMNDQEMEDLFEYQDEVSMILVQPENINELDKLKLNIEKILRKHRNVKIGEEDFEVSTPESSLSTVKSILGGVQTFIIIVALISVFIGSLGIVNTMTISVLERKKEIGIMKSIGARNNDIFMQFFIESGLLGLFGGFVGAVFGTLIGISGTMGINNWLGSEIPFNINFILIFFSLLGSFLIGAISGIVPAMRASRQNPVEALRG